MEIPSSSRISTKQNLAQGGRGAYTSRRCVSDEGVGLGHSHTDVSCPSSPEHSGPVTAPLLPPKSTVPFPRPAQSMPEGPPPGLSSMDTFTSEPTHGNSWLSSNSSVEPEPSSVAAKLRKEALDNPQEEPSIEELLSSMGVSLHGDHRMSDYSIAVEYRGPPTRAAVPEIKPLVSVGVEAKESHMPEHIESLPTAHVIKKASPAIGSRLVTPSGIENQRSSPSMTIESQATSEGAATPPLLSTETGMLISSDLPKRQQQGFPEHFSEATNSSTSGSLKEILQSPAEIQSSPPKGSQEVSCLSSGLSSVQETNSHETSEMATSEVVVDKSKLNVEMSQPSKWQEECSLGVQFHGPRSSDNTVEREVSSLNVSSTSLAAAGPATSAVLVGASPESVIERPSVDSGDSLASSFPSPSEASSLSGPIPRSSYMEEGVYVEPYRSGEEADQPPVCRSLPLSRSLPTDETAREPLDPMATKSEPLNVADNVGNRPMTPLMLHRKKGGCSGCAKGHLLQDKEDCMACSARYCSNCVLSAMGSMPEGRKCVACLGQPILGSRRPYIGKPSRLLKHMLSPLEVQQIMKAERECPANQLRPEQVVVNTTQLSHEELTTLLGCSRPPFKLKPGKYWYDSQTGLWGKEGHRPDRIISPSLKVGGNLQLNASNGRTQVYMNGRELGKLELKMLKFAGVHCPSDTHLWVENDGSYSEEGFKNVKGNIWGKEGNLWEKASIKLLYPFFSLPTPGSSIRGGNGSANRQSVRSSELLDQSKVHKLLLLGHEGSGRSTIFKQAKNLYKDGFTKEEMVNFKYLIQANIYKYMAILLEGRERFEEEEEDLAEHKQLTNSSIPSYGENSNSPTQTAGMFNWNDDKKKQKATAFKEDNIYRLKMDVKQLSDWFMENMPMGHMETAIHPSAAHAQEHASKIEQLWLNPAMQATFKRKSELHFLPDVANYFLNRVVEVSRSEYEPTQTDILQTEGLSQGSGLVQVEFPLEDKIPYSGSWQDTEPPSDSSRYQLIRVGGKGMSDRHKWLDMFEDVCAVVFCVALSDYDSLWIESSGSSSNKMIQTRDLFESILRHPCFQDTPFVLLLNKYDVFEQKICNGVPLTTCAWFSDFRPVGTSHYTAQNQAQQAYQYIAHKYKELFNSVNCTGRKLFTYQLNALDKTTVAGAFQYVREILKWEDHKAAGWGMIPEDLSYTTDASSFSQRSMSHQSDESKRITSTVLRNWGS